MKPMSVREMRKRTREAVANSAAHTVIDNEIGVDGLCYEVRDGELLVYAGACGLLEVSMKNVRAFAQEITEIAYVYGEKKN
jgi:hypothetical protein